MYLYQISYGVYGGFVVIAKNDEDALQEARACYNWDEEKDFNKFLNSKQLIDEKTILIEFLGDT
jgi:hypothetical protein